MPFSISLEKEVLIFSAAHFITFRTAGGETVCESLHGHNYRVAARVFGEPGPDACVVDFIWLRDRLRDIVATLDHRVLLPDRHPDIRVEESDGQVVARYEDRRWSFPAADVVRLPVDNTTAERLAEFIGLQLADLLRARYGRQLRSLVVGVDENEGQWAYREIDLTET